MKSLNILKIVRVHIVAGGFLAFSLGALLAIAGGGSFDPVRFVFGYVVVLLGDLSTHYGNDYFDVEVDKCIKQKKFFTGSGVLVKNPNLRSLSKFISLAFLVCSNVLATLVVVFLGLPLEFFIVILGASLLGWFYSAPPLRLISRGLGEVVVAFVTGFAIPGLGYLAISGQLDSVFVYFAIPFFMYGFILSLSLHAPDVEVDRRGGKRNLTVRLGQHRGFFLILTMAFLATLSFCIYAWQNPFLIVDFRVVVLFSIIPLVAGLLGAIGYFQKKEVDHFSTLNVSALFLFNMLMITYLLIIVLAV
jgi:1,4-dihydroxy-2-naphthoate octaprenyltransferase